MPHRVIVGLPQWQTNGSTIFAERLVRGLVSRGHEARILLTEAACLRIPGPLAVQSPPGDLPCDMLPAGADDTWGQRWEALERYLEEWAPCCYLMLHDYRNNVVAPRLSHRVRLIGLVQADSEHEIEQAGRLGEFWDAIVAVSDPLQFKLASLLPHLAPRLVTIRNAVHALDAPPEEPPTGTLRIPRSTERHEHGDDPDDMGRCRETDMLERYLALFEKLESLGRRGGFSRHRGPLMPAPQTVGGVGILLPDDNTLDAAYANETVRWPDSPVAFRHGCRTVPAVGSTLEEHRVLVASCPGTISGVDVFAVGLVRGLRERGIDARLHGRRAAGEHQAPAPDVVPFEERDPAVEGWHLDWPSRWRIAASQINRLAPCIYIPNYDADYSCMAPLLSEGVRVVGVGHSDDPWHYDHLCRIGPCCDGIVGVSDAISNHLKMIAPEFSSRMETIPYGVALPDGDRAAFPQARSPDSGHRLRIIYAGRLVREQKRALDVVAVARMLRDRNVPFEMIVVGDGVLRGDMERAVHDLIRDRRVWFTGAQPNAGVLSLLEASDAFLLPSAFEGLSIGMLEAMSRGVVPVVSDIRSGVPDVIVPGANGLTAPVGDTAAFTDRLEWLWKHPEELSRMAAAARATVHARYRVDQMVDRYIDLFRRIIATPIARPTGPIVPPRHLATELSWSRWASRVASDPAASLRRVARRFTPAPW